MSEIDVTKCPFYYYDDNFHQKENCTRSGSYTMGNPPCTRNCRWYAEQKLLVAKETIEAKEQECQELHNKYEQALDEIGKLIPKFESSDACDYGDFDCENCSDLDEDTVCAYKLKKVIQGIINKAKDSE